MSHETPPILNAESFVPKTQGAFRAPLKLANAGTTALKMATFTSAEPEKKSSPRALSIHSLAFGWLGSLLPILTALTAKIR